MPTDKLSDNQELSKAEIVRDVIIAVLGNNEMFLDNYLLILAHFGIVLMFICHMPFMFFIGKEHILTCVDEYYNNSLSLMVTRIRDFDKGDHRYFLVERKHSLRNSHISSELTENLTGLLPDPSTPPRNSSQSYIDERFRNSISPKR